MLATTALVAAPITAAMADSFGSGSNQFTVDFVDVGNTGNVADSTGYGAVPYAYRIGRHEISHGQVANAVALGLSNVSSYQQGSSAPVYNASWQMAVAFVNWLNTSSGHQPAYNLTYSGGWEVNVWSPSEAWQLGGQNLFRHKDAFYFLPSEDEWYKAAYHKNDGDTGNYWDYPTSSDIAPTRLTNGGTEPNTARFGWNRPAGFVSVDAAGGSSPYGTMGQGGNGIEYLESAFDGTNDAAWEQVTLRGGSTYNSSSALLSSSRQAVDVNNSFDERGFRVASIPEPTSVSLVLLAVVIVGFLGYRQRLQAPTRIKRPSAPRQPR